MAVTFYGVQIFVNFMRLSYPQRITKFNIYTSYLRWSNTQKLPPIQYHYTVNNDESQLCSVVATWYNICSTRFLDIINITIMVIILSAFE